MAKKNKQKLAQPSKEHAEELKASLTAYNDSFTTLLNMVPAKYYLTQEDDGESAEAPGNMGRKQKRKASQLAAKEKMELSLAKRAAKKAKYDPSTPRTVTEIQAAREEQKKSKAQREADSTFLKGFDFEDNAKQTNGRQDNDNESDSENDVDFVGSDDDIATAAPSTSARPSIAELRANLQAQSKASSTAGDTANGDDSVIDVEGSSAGKEALLAERKRQAELREKRRKNTKARIRKEKEEGTSTFKGQQKESMSALPEASSKPSKMSDIKKQLKKEGKRQFFNFDTEGEQAKADAASSTASALSVPTSHTESAIVPQASTSAAAAIPSNSIAFSSLDFKSSSALNEVDAPKLSKKQRDMLSKNSKLGVTSHNPTVALSALNKREEFLSKLTPEARERAEEKDKWERMAMRAEGTKVYDDEAKLKKMLKKKEKSKDKSRKDWADRKETIQKTQQAAAKKREENISARLQQKKDKKMGVKPSKSVGKQNAKKKGRPGFEGKGGSKRK